MKKPKIPSPLLDVLAPPPHIPHRCGAKTHGTGAPCRKWACFGRERCRLHGGAAGSGRPPTTGRHTEQALRSRHVRHVVRSLLALHFYKPDPIDAPHGSYDSESVRAQTMSAQRMGTEAASPALSRTSTQSATKAGVAKDGKTAAHAAYQAPSRSNPEKGTSCKP
jgi:hypothetical protein